MINGWLIKRLNGAISSISCNSLYITYNTYNNTAIAAIQKERIDDINVKKLTADSKKTLLWETTLNYIS